MGIGVNIIQFTQLSSLIQEYNKNLLFLAGAGISMDPPSNLPSAKILMDAIIDYCANKKYCHQLKSIPNLRYEYIVEIYRDVVDHSLKYLEFFQSVRKPNSIHSLLAEHLVKGNCVITTNFDTLIERSLAQKIDQSLASYIEQSEIDSSISHKSGKAVILKEDFEEYLTDPNFDSKYIPIFKFHGSPINYFTKQNTKPSVVTTLDQLSQDRADAQNSLSLPPYKEKVFHKLDNGRFLIVLGYGGGDTFDIIPELVAMNELKGILWISHTMNAAVKTKWPIFDYQYPIAHDDERSTLASHQEILAKIAEIQQIPVIEIQGTTSSILEALFPHYKSTSKTSKDTTQSDQVKFESWLQKKICSPDSKQKLIFTARILKNYELYKPALEVFTLLKEYANLRNEKSLISYSLNEMGLLYQDLGEFQEALECFETALSLNSDLNDNKSLATDYLNLGSLYQLLGKKKKAVKYLDKSYKINFKQGNVRAMMASLSQLGSFYHSLEDWDASQRYYNWALDEARELGDQKATASILNNLGEIHRNREEVSQARRYYSSSLEINKALGDQHGMAVGYNNMGLICTLSDQTEEALSYFEQSYKMITFLGNKPLEATVLNNLGGLSFSIGEYKQAQIYFQKALVINEEMGDQHGIDLCNENLEELEVFLLADL